MRSDTDGALQHYREALRFRPDHAGTHNNLGNLLLGRGRAAEAAASLRRALELDPEQAEAHNNLGRLLWEQGRTADAIGHYRRALEIRPQAAAPRFNLALALASAGSSVEALEQFEEGVRREPNALEAYVALAWLFGTHPDSAVRRPHHALELGGRAARLLGQPHPRILDVIAAAEAAAGRFDRAAEVAAEALRLASAMGDDTFADALRERLNLYRQQRPYLDRGSDARSSRTR
jgi:tetratricopeptide (TPR) repeat protein